MRIAIVDDIKEERDKLADVLTKQLSRRGIHVNLFEFENGEDFLIAAKERPFTVVFLDIYMNGANGIETARELRIFDSDALLIFTTTSTDHALDGFKVRAMHYLVKPYPENEISDLIDEVLSRIPDSGKYIDIKVNGSNVQVPFRHIIYAEHFSHMIHIHTTGGKELITRQSFEAFTASLTIWIMLLILMEPCLSWTMNPGFPSAGSWSKMHDRLLWIFCFKGDIEYEYYIKTCSGAYGNDSRSAPGLSAGADLSETTAWQAGCMACTLLAGICLLEGGFCYFLNVPTSSVLFPTLLVLMLIYHKSLNISIWKSGSIFLAICAVFACVNSLSRAVNAIVAERLGLPETELWFHTNAGIFYNVICLLFVAAAWYPASHAARTMIDDENLAQTWYVFWILPLIFIGLNLFMIPKYEGTLYTGRILQGYIVISLVLLVILMLFYTMFLMMANSLNKNARLQQENHFLSLQQARYENLCSAIEEARQARHDIRHHFLQLSSLAEKGDLEKIKEYLSNANSKIPDYNLHFCENQAADSVISHYAALAKRENIPFQANAALPAHISIDQIDMCLVLSNLLENALEASLKAKPFNRSIHAEVYLHHKHLLLIQVENTFEGKIQEKNHIFQSSKRPGNGVGIQSVRHIAEKNGGDSSFTYENGVFTAKIMLRIQKTAVSHP